MMFDLSPTGFAALSRRGMRTSLFNRVPPMPFSCRCSGCGKPREDSARDQGRA